MNARRAATAVAFAIVTATSGGALPGCIPVGWEADRHVVVVENETDTPLYGVILPSNRDFDIASNSNGGRGTLDMSSRDCNIVSLDLYEKGTDAKVASIQDDRLCEANPLVTYRGPNDASIVADD